MLNPRLAGRYAKSLIDLGVERNTLDELFKDVKTLQAICDVSREFVTLVKSPVIKPEKKKTIIRAVTEGKVSELMTLFLDLLVAKTRESSLPEILSAFVIAYNNVKGIHYVHLHTAMEISETVKQEIVKKVLADTPLTNIQLVTKVKEDLIGGYVVTYNNVVHDASIKRYLKDVKAQFAHNDYIFNIR